MQIIDDNKCVIGFGIDRRSVRQCGGEENALPESVYNDLSFLRREIVARSSGRCWIWVFTI